MLTVRSEMWTRHQGFKVEVRANLFQCGKEYLTKIRSLIYVRFIFLLNWNKWMKLHETYIYRNDNKNNSNSEKRKKKAQTEYVIDYQTTRERKRLIEFDWVVIDD